ncbi:phosphoinositide 3-kinase regulatory subunit 4-like isoform X2 [Paramacrobiotus metropolitanus]|uniref:phosphoinositide 3-kinase regulatory subunit 4-like isoform X2 n=1 Tax=Paramacrobiotus metropolitanus TaxID=2943436 RepID=UPI00244632C2|nr:phosphoinositide 3-kinase regulatory subunit 4-like isoform X2 [Paramacrobiotus metropolitanus]
MGNQYSVSGADQIYPIEHYLMDLPGFQLSAKLGSTRFMKVARTNHKEGSCVVKVFVIHDRSLSLEPYDKALQFQRENMQSFLHCLPFSFFTKSDKFAALCRTYIKDTLYDRMSARPYLVDIEKRWIAFQILNGLQECHAKNIYHGDIKSANIAITSWNWVYLVDFASYKPTYLPDGDPADFNYFFDTSRRRTCYIAPERFLRGVAESVDVISSKINLPDQQQEVRMGALDWSMDIFSVGCVFLEFFGDGEAPFDLSKLLAYRNGEFYPSDAIKKVESEDLRVLIQNMIEKDPSVRHRAIYYLNALRETVFPECFYLFLNSYIFSYCTPDIPDNKIMRLRNDLSGVIEKLGGSSECIVLILPLLLSHWRNLSHSDAKLAALEIAEILAPLLPVEIVLDRLLPYLLTCVEDRLAIVRASFIKTFVKVLQAVPCVRRNEGHIFRAYILPDMEKLVDDNNQHVRITFAMHIAQIAEIAMTFLERSYLCQTNGSTANQDSLYSLHDEDRYPFDVERILLLKYLQSLLEKLILKQSNAVKRALLEYGMGKLCQVFGRKLTRESILPHLVTFLNEKPDWQLRAAFFRSIVGLASFVGLEGAGVFRALLEQGLTDPEEFVVFHALTSFLDLVKLQLIPKKSIMELLAFCSALLVHPNSWIRRTAVALFAVAAKKTDYADQQIRIRPMVLPFLDHQIVFIDNEESLSGALMPPLNRRIYSIFSGDRAGRKLLEFLEGNSDERLRIVNDNDGFRSMRASTIAENQLYQKLHAHEIVPTDKAKVLLMKDFIMRLRLPSPTMEQELAIQAEDQAERTKNTVKIGPSVPIRSIPEPPGLEAVDSMSSSATLTKGSKQLVNDVALRTAMNEEWDTVFKPSNVSLTPVPVAHESVGETVGESRDASLVGGASAIRVRIPTCERELQSFIQNRQQERGVVLSNEVSLSDLEPPPMYADLLKEWRPSGTLVAHLHEHPHGIVSCSLDGAVKLWDCAKMEGRGLSNRAKYTYKSLGSPVRAMTYCEEWKSFACAGENGAIHVVRMDADHSKGQVKLEKFIDPKRDGIVVEMGYCDPGSQNIITFCTSMGAVCGWDLRTPNFVWKLDSDLRHGMLKTFCVSSEQSWITTGSMDGYMITWDLRFRLAISSLHHPMGSAIGRLYTHPKLDNAVIACVKGNNEVSVWDTETGLRLTGLWSGLSQPL